MRNKRLMIRDLLVILRSISDADSISLPEFREELPGQLQKAVGVDVDLHAYGAVNADACEPVAQHCLQVDLAPGLNEKPAAVAAAQHGERCRGRAEHGHTGELGCRASERSGGEVGGVGLAGADDECCEP